MKVINNALIFTALLTWLTDAQVSVYGLMSIEQAEGAYEILTIQLLISLSLLSAFYKKPQQVVQVARVGQRQEEHLGNHVKSPTTQVQISTWV
jgi:hypothetical protein